MRVEYEFIHLEDSDLYRDNAAHALAAVFDLGVNVAGLSGQYVADLFIVSGLAVQFERCNPVYVAGKSGAELLRHMDSEIETLLDDEVPYRLSRTSDYWVGWNVAWYQLSSGRTYKSIFEVLPYDRIKSMYYPLHEADERKFIGVCESVMAQASVASNLKRIRVAAGFSQAQLSEASGVGLRSIQMYEQRQKDINKAQGSTLLRLARALHCSMEDVMEL